MKEMSKEEMVPEIGDPTGSSRVSVAGSCLLASGVVFLLFTTVAEGLYPNYSVASDTLSTLGFIGAKTFFLWNSQLFVTGLLLLLGMYILFYKSQFRLGIRRPSLVGILFLLPGVGAILPSLVPGNITNSLGIFHDVGAFIVFILGGISTVYSYKLTNASLRYFSLVLGVVSLVMIPVYIASPHHVAGSISGTLERLIAYPYFLWVISFGSYLIGVDTGR